MINKQHSLFASICLGLTLLGSAAAANGAEAWLARVDVAGPVAALDLPVYAWQSDAAGVEYLLVIAPPAQVAARGWRYTVLDTNANAPEYVIARERRAGARTQAAKRFHTLLDDGKCLVIRATADEAETLAEMGFDLCRLSARPMLLPDAGRAPARWKASVVVTNTAFIADMVSQVHTADLRRYLVELSGVAPAAIGGAPYTIVTRNTTSGTPVANATQYAYEHLRAAGLSVEYQPWTNSGYNGRNVIATKVGGARSNEIVLVTAHIDDMPGGAIAPGADDNGSGSAGVLLAADILTAQRYDCTLQFALFTGEEQGLLGSAISAQQAFNRSNNIVAVHNLDMIAWDALNGPTLNLHTRTTSNPAYSNDLAIAACFTAVCNTYGLSNSLVPQIVADSEPYSDHASFWNCGYPGILAIEDDSSDFNAYYHTTNDVLAYVNQPYMAAFVKASLGTLAHLASVAAMPARVLARWDFAGHSTAPATGAGALAWTPGMSTNWGDAASGLFETHGYTADDTNRHITVAASTAGALGVGFSFVAKRDTNGPQMLLLQYTTNGTEFVGFHYFALHDAGRRARLRERLGRKP